MLSTVTITKNEENNIARCLKSLAFADERIVIDSGSTDRTVQTAKENGANVYHNPWPGYGPQKNFGLDKAKSEWVLFIDADEEVTPDLAREIKLTMEQWSNGATEQQYYWLKIITVFLGKPLRHLFGHNLRLFRKNTARWTDSKVHEQVTRISESLRTAAKNGGVAIPSTHNRPLQNSSAAIPDSNNIIRLNDPDTITLSNPLLHHSHATIKSYLAKMHRYTTLDAQEMAKAGKHRSGRPVAPSLALPWRLSIRQFIKLYFYRRGIMDGYAGLMWCALSGYYEYEMARKYIKNPKPQYPMPNQ